MSPQFFDRNRDRSFRVDCGAESAEKWRVRSLHGSSQRHTQELNLKSLWLDNHEEVAGDSNVMSVFVAILSGEVLFPVSMWLSRGRSSLKLMHPTRCSMTYSTG
jgi:hypothetical protein